MEVPAKTQVEILAVSARKTYKKCTGNVSSIT